MTRTFPAIKVRDVDYHRNGVGGEGFHLVQFDDDGRRMLASVFTGDGRCAVVCPDLPHLRWRGDRYEPELRAAIARADEDGTAYEHKDDA
jgi:hypothetical protein